MYMEFGALLASLREEAGFSQAELGRIIKDIRGKGDHSYISRLESGLRQPSREFLLALSQALELSDNEGDKLLVSAGFLPKDPFYFLLDETSRNELIAQLNSPREDNRKTTLREAVRLVAQSIVD